jgi:hypothetical protein
MPAERGEDHKYGRPKSLALACERLDETCSIRGNYTPRSTGDHASSLVFRHHEHIARVAHEVRYVAKKTPAGAAKKGARKVGGSRKRVDWRSAPGDFRPRVRGIDVLNEASNIGLRATKRS